VISNFLKIRRCGRKIAQRGFTLVEILATFVLIAIIIPVVMEGISLSIKLGVKSKRQAEAGALAETRLAEMLLSGDYDNGKQSGDFETDGLDYTWSLEVKDWEKEGSMQQLIMTVDWTDSLGMDHSVELATLAYSEGESESE
jgi:prepilin-type N-terminal cleavage/methylation domain-containing protein